MRTGDTASENGNSSAVELGVNVIPQVSGSDVDSVGGLVVGDFVHAAHGNEDSSGGGEAHIAAVATALDL